MHKFSLKRGFTLIELMIVIVVIAILATITAVSYSNVQARARDAARMEDINHIADALKLYGVKHGNLIGVGSGCGSSGNGYGWFNRGSSIDPNPPDASYPRAIVDCLADDGIIRVDTVDPTGTYSFGAANQAGHYTYMKYNCVQSTAPKVAYVFIKLETQDPEDRMDPNAICDGTNASVISAYNNYGMNYYIKVTVN